MPDAGLSPGERELVGRRATRRRQALSDRFCWEQRPTEGHTSTPYRMYVGKEEGRETRKEGILFNRSWENFGGARLAVHGLFTCPHVLSPFLNSRHSSKDRKFRPFVRPAQISIR